jgi:hypothetical protein
VVAGLLGTGGGLLLRLGGFIVYSGTETETETGIGAGAGAGEGEGEGINE